MEDLSDVLKRQFCDLYKKKTDVFGTVQDRVIKMNEQRKTNRHNTVLEKRKIPENMSPITPVVKREKIQHKKESVKKDTKQQPPVNKRLEMLAKWKAEKERRKQQEKSSSKPIFKVSHVPITLGLPNLENVNRVIKGKSFKSTFAPPNHTFKPPANIKPIEFNVNNKTPSVTKQTTPQKNQEKVQSEHRMVLRSRTRNTSSVSTSSVKTNKPDINKRTTSSKKDVKERRVAATGTKKNGKKTLNSETTQDASSLFMSPDYPVDRDNQNISEDSDTKTPKKTEPPVYISPFVTVSRGKNSARKEYEARRSGKSFSANPDLNNCTSPKAGAAYFNWLLNNQTSRLEELCEHWQKYKDEMHPPDEAISMIDVAIGQTNLLLTKKFAQFRSLIDKCKEIDGEKPVTCEDLHGFWDMMHLQIDNLDKRFENLTNLRTNDWHEIVPEPKKEPTKKRGRPPNKVKASSALKEAIKAARKKNLKESVGGEEDQIQKTVERRTSRRSSTCRLTDIKSEKSNNHRNSSPGLMVMKIAQYAKTVETPAKSILKTDAVKSAKSHSKSVLFQDEVTLNTDNDENDFNSTNISKAKTPQRRSLRLSKNKLF